MKLAAIDIGSNAIRLQITKVIEFEKLITFKKLEYVRFPLRLGHDVFKDKRISPEREEKFMKLMSAYRSLIDLYEIEHYYACATSAMREAENAKAIIERTRKETGLKIHIISGEREAELINNIISLDLDEKVYLHIDVGGGSTELNFYKNKMKVLSKSFKVGSVRRLDHADSPKTWIGMQKWIREQVKDYKGTITAIGTGGNINKIYEIAQVGKKRRISLDLVMKVQDFLRNMTFEERTSKLQLNPDRADVIIPAAEIYVHAMQSARAKAIIVPEVGLKDGINYYLFEKYYPTKGKVWVRN